MAALRLRGQRGAGHPGAVPRDEAGWRDARPAAAARRDAVPRAGRRYDEHETRLVRHIVDHACGARQMIGFVRRVWHPIFERAPRVRSRALAALDIAVRPVLWFFRLERPRFDAAGAAALEGKTDDFNKAAETYY